MFRTSNPTLNENIFRRSFDYSSEGRMTLNGAVNKTALLLLIVVAAASWTWGTKNVPLMWLGLIGGLIAALVTIFKKEWAPVSAPVYAAFEGLFLGGISAIFERAYHGIVFQAVTLTFGILFSLLIAYRTGVIRATEKFKLGIVAATGAICLIYMVDIILGLFGVRVPFIHETGLIGIGFSLFVIVIASLNLILDFDLIEQGVAMGAPKFMEWYGAFGLMVTLIWLYIEILNLLSKLRRN
jgi:uncharacterized YccA/Bax inhibitor family protein